LEILNLLNLIKSAHSAHKDFLIDHLSLFGVILLEDTFTGGHGGGTGSVAPVAYMTISSPTIFLDYNLLYFISEM